MNRGLSQTNKPVTASFARLAGYFRPARRKWALGVTNSTADLRLPRANASPLQALRETASPLSRIAALQPAGQRPPLHRPSAVVVLDGSGTPVSSTASSPVFTWRPTNLLLRPRNSDRPPISIRATHAPLHFPRASRMSTTPQPTPQSVTEW